MREIEIEIFNIAKTKVEQVAVQEWLKHLGTTTEYQDDIDRLLLEDTDQVTNPALLIALAAKRCFDSSTQILTNEGWKYFKDLNKQEMVMTMNPRTGFMEWQKPHGYLNEVYDGPMVSVEGRDISMLVTPDHRVYGNGSFVQAKDLFDIGEFWLPVTASGWIGCLPAQVDVPLFEISQSVSNQFGSYGTRTENRNNFKIKGRNKVIAFAKLITFFAAEGHLNDNGSGRLQDYVSISGYHIRPVQNLCSILGLTCRVSYHPKTGCPEMRIGGGKRLANYMRSECGGSLQPGNFPRWVLDLPVDQLKEIWTILVDTDGTRARGAEQYLTSSVELAGQVQEILAKIGSWGSLMTQIFKDRPGRIKSNYPQLRVRRRLRKEVRIRKEGNVQPEWQDYKGTIHCVSTENGIVYVRRNRSAFWSGNCYMSFEAGLNPNVTKVRKDFTEYIDNILKSGHGSVLEHSTYTFAIEGVSRVFTGEMNRHRAGVGISEGSMRYIRFTDIPFWMPTSLRLTDDEQLVISSLVQDYDVDGPEDIPLADDMEPDVKLAIKKSRSQEVFRALFQQSENAYKELCDIWKDELEPSSPFKDKKHITSMMRRIIPMGVATGGVWTMNIRAIRHVMAMRTSPAAEEEILHVFSRITKMIVESEPMLCGDFTQTTEGYWTPKYPKV